MKSFRLWSVPSLFFFILGCHVGLPDQKGFQQGSRRVVFTAVDPLSFPWYASLYVLNLDHRQENPVEILSGESSDPWLSQHWDGLLLWNRADDNRNMRLLEASDRGMTIHQQRALTQLKAGDPHDLVLLDDQHALIAQYVGGQVAIMHRQNQDDFAALAWNWGLGESETFSPEGLALYPIGDQLSRVFIFHQGFAFRDGLMYATGTSRAYYADWRQSDSNFLHSDQQVIPSIALKGSFPVPLNAGENILAVSLCSRFAHEGSLKMGTECASYIETIDPRTAEIIDEWDLGLEDLFMNGNIAFGEVGHIVYMQTERRVRDQSISEIRRFDLTARTHEAIYTYDEDSGGYWGLAYDRQDRRLFIGDRQGGSYFLIAIRDGLIDQRWLLDHVPYSIQLMPE